MRCAQISIVNLAERFQAQPAGRVALVVGDRTVSYEALAARVNAWRGGLTAAGLEPGDRVAIVAGNSEIFVVGYLAALTGGFVAVPLNPTSPAAVLGQELAEVEASAVIVDRVGQVSWAQMKAEDGSPSLAPTGGGCSFIADGDAFPELDRAEPTPLVPVPDEHHAVLLYTSGTAGRSKPAVLTHGNLSSSLVSLGQLPDVDLDRHHQVLAVIPLFHVFGLNVIVNLGLSIGATLVLEEHVAPAHTAELLRRHNVSMVLGPPNMWSAFLGSTDLLPGDFEQVEIAVSGAAKLSPVTWQALRDRFGVDVREGYGLTETGGIVASAAGVGSPAGSVGVPMPGVDLRLVDPEGRDVLVGDPGEIWVKGPMVSPGYWIGGEVLTYSRTDDGWLKTGDLGVVDDLGHLSIVDRLKDLIIVSGFNVHPGEVEEALAGHPDVAAVGVVGEVTEEHGEQVVAHVVAVDGRELDLDELGRHAASLLARYKVPRRFVVVDSLPTGVAGKLRRRELH
ncbi:MAG: long-chain acyl-CoA synthetase [Acidimicrobiales bacterium]